VAITLSSFFSFFGKTGPALQDSGDLTNIVKYALGSTNGITALAGGAQAGAPVLNPNNNEINTVVTANDSVQLPLAIPGVYVFVFNNATSGNTCRIYANSSPNAANPSASGAAQLDQIQQHASQVLTGNTTPLTLAAGYVMEFTCTTVGVWKQQYAAS